jgi:cytochrome c oxidase subunit 2
VTKPTARGGRGRFGALAGVAMLVLAACGDLGGDQSALRPAGDVARKADSLWDLTFGIAVVVFILVEGALIYAVIKFRKRPGREPAQFHGNTRIEVLLTVVPALILAGIAVPTVQTIFQSAEIPQNALEVKIIAHQFWWEYQYVDEGVVTANELHMPTDQPVYLTLEGALVDRVDSSQPEVNHSFWVPRLGGTQDIVPGRVNHLVYEADEPGTYLGQCKEFCGLGHAYMRLRAIAHTPEEFERWLADQKEPAPAPQSGLAAEGAELFVNGPQSGQWTEGYTCASCHAADTTEIASQNVGPNLTHFAERQTFAAGVFDNNAENLAAWLDDPAGVKPGARMPTLGLTQEEIDALIAYLETRN